MPDQFCGTCNVLVPENALRRSVASTLRLCCPQCGEVLECEDATGGVSNDVATILGDTAGIESWLGEEAKDSGVSFERDSSGEERGEYLWWLSFPLGFSLPDGLWRCKLSYSSSSPCVVTVSLMTTAVSAKIGEAPATIQSVCAGHGLEAFGRRNTLKPSEITWGACQTVRIIATVPHMLLPIIRRLDEAVRDVLNG